MRLKPFFARVLLEKELPKTSLVIPDKYKQGNAKPYGKIISVGPTCDPSIKEWVGKVVMIGKFAGDWIKAPDGSEFYVCADEDLLAGVEE